MLLNGRLGIGVSPADPLHVVGATRKKPSSGNHTVLMFDKSTNTDFGSNSCSFNAFGRNGDGHSRVKFYNSRAGYTCSVIVDGSTTANYNQTLNGQ